MAWAVYRIDGDPPNKHVDVLQNNCPECKKHYALRMANSRYRVRAIRSVKGAKELADKVMKLMGWEREGSWENVDLSLMSR